MDAIIQVVSAHAHPAAITHVADSYPGRQNDIALARLTHLVVPHLERSNKTTRSKSLILNIGSLVAPIPSPLLSTYSASKQFVATFTNCIARELAPKDIVVRLVIPGFVVSKMSKIRTSSAWAPTPSQFVRATLSSIGLARGAQGRPYESTPWWMHAVTDYVVRATGLTNFATWYTGRGYRAVVSKTIDADSLVARHASGYSGAGASQAHKIAMILTRRRTAKATEFEVNGLTSRSWQRSSWFY